MRTSTTTSPISRNPRSRGRHNHRRNERFKRGPPTRPPHLPIAIPRRPVEFRLETDTSPALEQLPPVARLGRGREIAVPEHGGAVLRNPLRFLGLLDVVRDLAVEIREVARDFDDVLVGTRGDH